MTPLMMPRWLCFTLLLMISCGTSWAETPSAVPWTPTECGAEPEKPAVDLSDAAKYRKSVDEVKAYEEQAKAWNTCVMKEANAAMVAVNNDARAKMTAISEGANRIQSRLWAGFQDYTEQFKAAQEKLDNNTQQLEATRESIREIREQWEPELDAIVSKISDGFSHNFQKIKCAGQVGVYKDEDFEKWAIQIQVRFRSVL